MVAVYLALVDIGMMLRSLIFLLVIISMARPVVAGEVILPRLKPDIGTASDAAAPAAKAEPKAIAFPGDARTWSADAVNVAQRQCRSLLAGLDIDYETMGSIGREGGCGTAEAILITAVSGVRISPPAEANCAFAEALHHWISWSAKPAAKEYLKKRLVVINNASAYVCRRRNNSATGKMSEHAIVNALDIATLGFDDGSSISIKGDWSGLKQLIGATGKASFLARVRRDACIRFTTVLGPGTDPFHGDHFHIDLARRKSGYRICN